MSSYLEKYHLQKVQPVRGRPHPYQRQPPKLKQKVQKNTSVKVHLKPRTNFHKHQYFQPQEVKPQIQFPKTQQLIKPRPSRPFEHPSLKSQLPTKMINTDKRIEDQSARGSRTSLNFKSNKDLSAGNKIISSIQGFFNRIKKSDDGCLCGNPCPHAVTYFQWVDVSFGIVKDHYFNLLHNYSKSYKQQQNSNDSSHCSIQQSLTHTSLSNSLFEQLRKNTIQIQKDILRTQSQSLTFQNSIYQQKIRNILAAYAYEDVEVGYIQGMNLILAGLIYHIKDEIKTFAVFRKLIYSIRSIYFNDFKQCYQHIDNIRKYLNTHVHDLYELFQQLGVDLNVVCLPWVLSLLTGLIPLEHLHLLYTGFIQRQWPFFYQLCLAIIIYRKQQLMVMEDSGDVLMVFSPTNQNRGDLDWQDIVQFAHSIDLS